jgi:phytoene desaturase
MIKQSNKNLVKNNMQKKIGIIGSGFSSLASAAVLAKHGFEVHVYEKNEHLGGRARKFEVDGFNFDMGPSWYWMPDVFEQFFKYFGKKSSDFYELKRLDPSYKVVFGKDDEIDMPANYEELKIMFEEIEPGSGANLDKFLSEAEYKYKVGMEEFVWKPGESIFEFAEWKVVKSFFKLDMLKSLSSQVSGLFKSPKIRQILEFPVLFLGATPQNTPALYSLMNYADIKLGTWYPMGGMHKIIEAFVAIGKEYGVKYHVSSPVTKISKDNVGSYINVDNISRYYDYIVAGADYQHVDQSLLHNGYKNYDSTYWETRSLAPSSILFYLGVNKKVEGLEHHNLFFDEDFNKHAEEIYTTHQWPKAPLFYVCVPSITDASVAPKGCENIFILIPISTELANDNEDVRNKYLNIALERLKNLKGVDIKDHIIYKRSFCISDFKKDYNAYKGNAYGLANTLKQTAILKPKLKSDHIKNLYFTGMPPSIISGQMVANLIISNDSKNG